MRVKTENKGFVEAYFYTKSKELLCNQADEKQWENLWRHFPKEAGEEGTEILGSGFCLERRTDISSEIQGKMIWKQQGWREGLLELEKGSFPPLL